MSHFRKAPVAFHLGMDDLVPLRVRQKSKVKSRENKTFNLLQMVSLSPPTCTSTAARSSKVKSHSCL